MRSNIKYIVNRLSFDVTTGKYNSTIVGRDAQIEVVADTEKEVEYLHNNLIEKLNEISFKSSDCWSIEETKKGKYIIVDYINVNDKEEFEEVKEVYKEWKKGIKQLLTNIKTEEVKETVKNLDLTEENLNNLSLQIDNYEMLNLNIEFSSLDKIIEKYKNEFINDTNYTNYFNFLSDKLEKTFYNLAYNRI